MEFEKMKSKINKMKIEEYNRRIKSKTLFSQNTSKTDTDHSFQGLIRVTEREYTYKIKST